jgi:hypothetical protein
MRTDDESTSRERARVVGPRMTARDVSIPDAGQSHRESLLELAEWWSDRAEDLRLTAVMAATRAGTASTVPIARLRREAWAWATGAMRCRSAVEHDRVDGLADYLKRRSADSVVGAAFRKMADELPQERCVGRASSCEWDRGWRETCFGKSTRAAGDWARPSPTEGYRMSIFSSIMSKIVGHSAAQQSAADNAAMPATPAASYTAPAAAAAPAPTTASISNVDVAERMDELAKATKHESDWRSSIVDMMSLLGMDSDITNRRALASELGYDGDMNDSATMNVWLHKAVMQKLAENGGTVPANLLD